MGAVTLGVAVIALCGVQPASAACELVKATASSNSKANAAKASHALTLENARQLQRQRGWGSLSMSAYRVQGDPFWKAVRPGGVPSHAKLPPDIVTGQFYTTCFTGVMVPYVCTTGSRVCGN
jgi:hypothetical protein